jgi:hypothetical protein
LAGAPAIHHPVTVTADDPLAMRRAMAELSIDAAAVWSLCFETFSFAAYEATAAGVAVVTGPDSGNVAAFAAEEGRGVVLADEKELEAWFESGRILQFARSARRPTAVRSGLQQIHSRTGGGRVKVVCFSSFTYSYLDRARVLFSSVRRFHPSWELVALVTDDPPEGFSLRIEEEPFDRIMHARELGIPDFDAWLFKHDVVEACTAVKGPFLKQACASGAESGDLSGSRHRPVRQP